MSLLTKRQIILCQIIIAVSTILIGVMFLLVALDVLQFQLWQAAVLFIPLIGGIVLFILGFIQDNTLLIWVSIIFLCAAIVSFISIFGCCNRNFSTLYPIYILSPALASLIVGIYDNFKLKPHLKIILPLSALSFSFALNSIFNLHFGIVIACIFLFIALAFILFIIITFKGKPNDKDKK